MSQDDDRSAPDARVRRAMHALRDGDRQQAPPFDAMWRGAAAPRAKRRATFSLASAAAGVAAVAAITMHFATRPSMHQAAAPPALSVAPTTRALARVLIPTELALEFLLEPPRSSVALSFDDDPPRGGFR